jgi:hypothetical protein
LWVADLEEFTNSDLAHEEDVDKVIDGRRQRTRTNFPCDGMQKRSLQYTEQQPDATPTDGFEKMETLCIKETCDWA